MFGGNAIKRDTWDKDKEISKRYQLSASTLPFKMKFVQLLSLFATLRKEYSLIKYELWTKQFCIPGEKEGVQLGAHCQMTVSQLKTISSL